MMRPYISILAAACLTASVGLAASPSFGADTPGAQTPTFEEPGYRATLPAGIQAKQLNEVKDVKNAFQSVTESSLGSDPLNDIIDRLVDQDRDRLSQNKNTNDNAAKNGTDALSTIVKQIDSAWHSKYQSNLKIDESKVYTDTYFHIVTGEVSNPDQLVGHWPVSAGANSSTGGDMSSADAQKAHKMMGGDVNLEKGRNVAIVHLAGNAGCPAVTASLIHELPDTWKFDVPNTVTREALYQSLLSNLTHFYGQQAHWPADSVDATRALTNTVVASLYDINVANAARQMPEANMNQPHMNVPSNTNTLPNNTNRTAGER